MWRKDGITTLGYNEDGLFECLTSHLTAFSILVVSLKSTNGLILDNIYTWESIHTEVLSWILNIHSTIVGNYYIYIVRTPTEHAAPRGDTRGCSILRYLRVWRIVLLCHASHSYRSPAVQVYHHIRSFIMDVLASSTFSTYWVTHHYARVSHSKENKVFDSWHSPSYFSILPLLKSTS